MLKYVLVLMSMNPMHQPVVFDSYSTSYQCEEIRKILLQGTDQSKNRSVDLVCMPSVSFKSRQNENKTR